MNGNPILDTEEKVVQYSQILPWWEKKEDSASSESFTFPALLELVECQIIQEDMPWREENLPHNIKGKFMT